MKFLSLSLIKKNSVFIIIMIGIILRIVDYLHNKSLCLDEILLALNIFERSFSGLLFTLGQGQASPIGFLILEKLICTIFSKTEFSLRLLPLLSGIISVFLFYNFVKRFFNSQVTNLSVFLFSISNFLIYYSTQTKQYSSDVCITLILFNLITSRKILIKNSFFLLLTFTGVIVQFFSHPSIFILCGGMIYLIIFNFPKFTIRQKIIFIFTNLLWLIVFAVNYFYFYKNLTSNNYLIEYWYDNFLPIPLSFDALKTILVHLVNIHANTLKLNPSVLSLPLFLTGTVFLFKYHKNILTILFTPIILTLIASMMNKYPFGDRLILFLFPSFIIIISSGAVYFFNKIINITVKTIFIFLFLLDPICISSYDLVFPDERDAVKKSIEFIVKHQKSSDIIYFWYDSIYSYECYRQMKYKGNPFNKINIPVIKGNKIIDKYGNYSQLLYKKRVWILFSTYLHPNEKKHFINWLNEHGKVLKYFKTTGSETYLYDLSKT